MSKSLSSPPVLPSRVFISTHPPPGGYSSPPTLTRSVLLPISTTTTLPFAHHHLQPVLTRRVLASTHPHQEGIPLHPSSPGGFLIHYTFAHPHRQLSHRPIRYPHSSSFHTSPTSHPSPRFRFLTSLVNLQSCILYSSHQPHTHPPRGIRPSITPASR